MYICISVKDNTPGWASIAAKLAYGYNTLMFRKFEKLRVRILLDQQTKIQALDKRLQELDEADYERGDDQRLRALLFTPEQLIGGYPVPHLQGQCHSGAVGSSTIANDFSPVGDHGRVCCCPPIQDPKDRVMEALFWRMKAYSTAQA
jgi:hypothetical protein